MFLRRRRLFLTEKVSVCTEHVRISTEKLYVSVRRRRLFLTEKASVCTEHVRISTEKLDFYGEATCLYGEEVTLVGHRSIHMRLIYKNIAAYTPCVYIY